MTAQCQPRPRCPLSPSAAPPDPAPCPPQRPYEIHSATPVDEVLHLFKVERVHYSSTWDAGMVALLKQVRGPRACLGGASRLGDQEPEPGL